jgi:very-short-patch-repair endonuclease
MNASTELRLARRRRVERLASGQDGVVSLSEAYALGTTRAEVRANVAAGRWRRVGSQSIVVHHGQLTQDARFRAAVFEAGPRAQLDGESSLLAAGLRHYDSARIRVSVPRGARVRRARGLDIRQTRRWDADDLVGSGVARTRNEVAAVRAALWARSDKQAALLLTMTVQQGLATAEQLGVEVLRIRRARRRRLIHAVILDLLGGVRSLGELEFARECRRRGLPPPTRQVLRRGRNGRYYLDVVWEEWGVVVEIDGIQHAWADHVVADALRHNDVTLQDATVLRLPLLGLRVAADEFFAQIRRALAGNGCPFVDGCTA